MAIKRKTSRAAAPARSARATRQTRPARSATRSAKPARSVRSKRRVAPALERVARINDKFTKTELYEHLAGVANDENISKKEVKLVLDALLETAKGSLGRGGYGEFTIPGFVAFKLKHSKAVRGGKKAISPFTGEEYVTKDKPARTRGKAFVRGELAKYIEQTHTRA